MMRMYQEFVNKYSDVKRFVREYYEKTVPKDAPHPWVFPEFKVEHVLRVLKYSMMLAAERIVDLDVIALAALLHDIAAYDYRKNHAIEGSKIAEKYLADKGYPNELVKKVVRAIAVHSGSLAFEANTIEEKILQDADTIDKVGAFGITTFLLKCGNERHTPKQALDELKKALLPKLEWYRRTMHTPEGKRLVEEGCKYIEKFIEKLEKEL
jgi:uncharacterized protein